MSSILEKMVVLECRSVCTIQAVCVVLAPLWTLMPPLLRFSSRRFTRKNKSRCICAVPSAIPSVLSFARTGPERSTDMLPLPCWCCWPDSSAQWTRWTCSAHACSWDFSSDYTTPCSQRTSAMEMAPDSVSSEQGGAGLHLVSHGCVYIFLMSKLQMHGDTILVPEHVLMLDEISKKKQDPKFSACKKKTI